MLFYHFNTAESQRSSILVAGCLLALHRNCSARDQLRLSWTSNRHPASLNPGPLPVDDQNFPQLQGNTMAADRAHGFGAIMAQKGLHLWIVVHPDSESTRLATGVREKPPKNFPSPRVHSSQEMPRSGYGLWDWVKNILPYSPL